VKPSHKEKMEKDTQGDSGLHLRDYNKRCVRIREKPLPWK
jgi:hypothetical protein